MPDDATNEVTVESLENGADRDIDRCTDRSHAHSASVPIETLTVEKAQRMSEFMGFLADTNRLRILSILAIQEMCVGNLAIALEMNESAVSHQLRTLRAIRLVSFRKQGRHVFYRLQDHHVLSFYQAIADHLDETT